MPSPGRMPLWSASATEGAGLYLEAEQLSLYKTVLLNRSQFEDLYLTQASSGSLRQLDTRLTAMEVWSRRQQVADDMTDAVRYAMTHSTAMYRPNFLAPMELGRIDGQVRIIETPKENKMNEMMTALETMMRRIVKEELALIPAPASTTIMPNSEWFDTQLTSWQLNYPIKFGKYVEAATLDQGWFDDAIKTGVAEASPTPTAGGYAFANKDTFESTVRSFIKNDDDLDDWLGDHFNDRMTNVSFSTTVD